MRKLLFLVLALIASAAINAQNKKAALPAMPDVNQLMKMSPAELEAYKKKMIKETSEKAVEFAAANNMAINETLLPGYEPKPPVKDIKRLSLIPSRPPTRTELVSGIQQSIQQIQKGMPAPEIAAVNTTISTLPVEKINGKAILEFYSDNPRSAMLMLMQTAAKAPDSLMVINNLGAMFNLLGLEEKAAPLFQYGLAKLPNSSTFLNNLGQSFMGLGDLFRAAEYFNQCLAIDSLNLEANHSMGMLHYFKKEYDAAMKYFEREMSVAMRRSTMAMAYKMGKKFNLRELASRKNKRNGIVQKDFFEEINLGKFKLPAYAFTALDIKKQDDEWRRYSASVGMEQQFWHSNAAKVTRQYASAEGEKHFGIYHDLAQAMLKELHEEFTPEYLNNFNKKDGEATKEIMNTRSNELVSIKCPPPPPGLSQEAQRAYEIKCCEDKKRPVADKLVNELSSYVQPLFTVGQQRWKSYLNQLIAIVQLDPGPSNQIMVYNAVASYFAFLGTASLYYSAANVNLLIPDCVDDYDEAAIDSLIESKHDWQLECPRWLNVEVSIEPMTLKVDCNKFALEGGSTIMAGFEHEFKTKNSTILVGPGMKGDIAGLVKGEIKTQFYLTFDQNKEFADFGIKRTVEASVSGTPIPVGGISVGGNAFGVEVSDKASILTGCGGAEVEWKGAATRWFGGKP